tara:strand:- start:310 stop:486 length:177 start_codon:yes stop_codon:yes gene_type:complete
MEAFHQFSKEAVFKDMRYHKNLLLPIFTAIKTQRIKAENVTFFALEKSLWCFLFRLIG